MHVAMEAWCRVGVEVVFEKPGEESVGIGTHRRYYDVVLGGRSLCDTVYVFEIAGADGLRFSRGSTLLIVPKVL